MKSNNGSYNDYHRIILDNISGGMQIAQILYNDQGIPIDYMFLDVNVPKFALVSDGIGWYMARDLWKYAGETPSAGDIIFFDWESDGIADHTGIVERVKDGVVYTIEGNSGGKVKRQEYAVGSSVVVGYGAMAD